jgi:hypothetical protein
MSACPTHGCLSAFTMHSCQTLPPCVISCTVRKQWPVVCDPATLRSFAPLLVGDCSPSPARLGSEKRCYVARSSRAPPHSLPFSLFLRRLAPSQERVASSRATTAAKRGHDGDGGALPPKQGLVASQGEVTGATAYQSAASTIANTRGGLSQPADPAQSVAVDPGTVVPVAYAVRFNLKISAAETMLGCPTLTQAISYTPSGRGRTRPLRGRPLPLSKARTRACKGRFGIEATSSTW